MSIKILVVDDEPKLETLICQLFRRQIKAGEMIFLFASDGQEALKILQETIDIDILLTDINMPRMDGLSLLERLQEIKPRLNPGLVPIVISAYSDMENIRKAMNVGGFDFLTKPIDLEDLKVTVENTIDHAQLLKQTLEEKHQAENALRQLKDELEIRVERRTAELVEANTLLKKSNEELDAYARTVAHDLKNPLSLVLGYVDVLANFMPGMDEDEITEILNDMQQHAHKMSSIIDSLLVLARVRKGEVETTIVDMGTVVTQILQNRLDLMITETQTEIKKPDSWPLALGYISWVEEVWFNYIANAIKYGGTPPQLELGAAIQADGFVRFWVQDNGPGISEDVQSSLFTEFVRLEGTGVEGHGLGLSIVQRIVHKLGGSVGVDSILEQGSRFYFTLPSA